MDKPIRNAIERATQEMRHLLEDEFEEQLAGTFDILADGSISSTGGGALTAAQAGTRAALVAAIERKRSAGMKPAEAVADYLRDAAFTILNRFVALKMLEARGLVQECVSRGPDSTGYAEFTGMAPGLQLLPEGRGYRLYLESLFDELSTEVKVLFDRRDPAAALWPRRAAFEALLVDPQRPRAGRHLGRGRDHRLGLPVLQRRGRAQEDPQGEPFRRPATVANSPSSTSSSRRGTSCSSWWTTPSAGPGARCTARARMSSGGASTWSARWTSRSARGRPRTRGTSGSSTPPAAPGTSSSTRTTSSSSRTRRPTDSIGCRRGRPRAARSARTTRASRTCYRALPTLILEHNLYGVDIDARCAQIAALALWLRAQRAFKEMGIPASDRPRVRRTHIVIAEPMPGDRDLAAAFAEELPLPFQQALFSRMVQEMRLAGELGTLLQAELLLAGRHREGSPAVRAGTGDALP